MPRDAAYQMLGVGMHVKSNIVLVVVKCMSVLSGFVLLYLAILLHLYRVIPQALQVAVGSMAWVPVVLLTVVGLLL